MTPRGLLRVAYDNEAGDAVLEEVAEQVSPRILRAAKRTDEARRQLDGYFASNRAPSTCRSTGRWSTASRGACCGPPPACRSARSRPMGAWPAPRDRRAPPCRRNALGSNPIPIVVPCHRVLHADGTLGGYSGGLDRKRILLALEGSLPGLSVP